DSVDTTETLEHLHVVLHGGARDVHEHPGARDPVEQPRQVVRRHVFQPRIGQPDRVQHATPEFRDPWPRVTAPRLRRDGLGDDSAQPVEIHHAIDLPAEPSGPRGEEHRVLKGGTPERFQFTESGTARRPGPFWFFGTRPAGTSGGFSRGPRLPVSGAAHIAKIRTPAPAAGTLRMPNSRARESSAVL